MGGRSGHDAGGARRPAAALAAAALAAALLGWAAPSGADGGAVGAFGEQVAATVAGVAVASGPAPAVAPASGAAADDSVPGVTADSPPGGPYGDTLLRTGPLRVSAGAGATASAEADDVDALGGRLTAGAARTGCTAEGSAVSIEGGRLSVAGLDAVDLPEAPEPGRRYEATDPASGERLTVVLHDRHDVDGAAVVDAVHIVLGGPSAIGDIVVGRVWCGPAAVPATTSTTSSSTTTTTTTAPTTTTTALAAAEPEAAAAAPAPADPAPVAAPPADAELGRRAAVQTQTVTSVTGSAYGYSAGVKLFGNQQAPVDPTPAVSIPAGGGDQSKSAPSGKVVYGPADLFQSGAIDVSSKGTTGTTGGVASTAHVVGLGSAGPAPFLWNDLKTTCTAGTGGATGSTSVGGGIVATSTNSNGDPKTTVPVPSSPAANLTIHGTLDNVGDSYDMVFNEQSAAADGTLTVNGAHMRLLGPTAVGDLIIGQVRCGAQVASTEVTTPGSTTAPVSSSSAATPSTPATPASVATTTPPAQVQSASVSASSAATPHRASGDPLAFTGRRAPMVPALVLVAGGLVAARLRRRPPGAAHGR